MWRMGFGERVELWLDGAAAAVLGAAFAFCTTLLGAGAAGVVFGAAAFPMAFAGLRTVKSVRSLPLAEFEPVPFEFAADELLLTERVAEELLLDDALAPAPGDSRVVQLFGTRPLPTAGELHRSIEQHLASRQASSPDATQALSDALAELRRNLR